MQSRIACLLLGLFATATFAEQPSVDLYMTEAMPLAATKEPSGHGMVGDVALEAIKRAGFHANIKSVPWLRAQKRVREGHNLLLLPLSRTPAREQLYTWIAPVMPLYRAFFTLSAPVATLADARTQYTRIAVGIGTAQEEILLSQGFSKAQMFPLKLGDKPLRLLELKRIDAWFSGVIEGQYAARLHPHLALQMSPEMAPTDLYVACSISCDPKLVEALRASMETLRADGSIERIKSQYLNLPAP